MNYLCRCDPCMCSAAPVSHAHSSTGGSRDEVHGSVLHYAGLARNLRPGPVEEVSSERFANGRPIFVECRSASALNGQDFVRRARSRLGEDRYRLLTNNCEHFSDWSRFGTSRSPQVERLLSSAPTVIRTLFAIIRRGIVRIRSEGPNHR